MVLIIIIWAIYLNKNREKILIFSLFFLVCLSQFIYQQFLPLNPLPGFELNLPIPEPNLCIWKPCLQFSSCSGVRISFTFCCLSKALILISNCNLDISSNFALTWFKSGSDDNLNSLSSNCLVWICCLSLSSLWKGKQHL